MGARKKVSYGYCIFQFCRFTAPRPTQSSPPEGSQARDLVKDGSRVRTELIRTSSTIPLFGAYITLGHSHELFYLLKELPDSYTVPIANGVSDAFACFFHHLDSFSFESLPG
jgi:hypothetical protein